MIIVSQDKTKIMNFQNVNEISIRENTNTIRAYDNTWTDEQDGTILGNYRTEERAKEVLWEIIIAKSFFEKSNIIVDPMVRARLLMETKYNFWDTYEMPAE